MLLLTGINPSPPPVMKRRLLTFVFICGFLVLLCSDKAHFPQVLFNRSLAFEQEEEPEDWMLMQRSFPYGIIDEKAQREAVRMALEERKATRKGNLADDWESIGPVRYGGRVTDIEMPAGSPTTIYVAAASGGIFKTYDQGETWFPVFDGQPSLAIGDIVIAPDDTSTIYAGTGEPNAGGGSLAYDGTGIYKSADGGATWAYIGLQDCGSTGRLAVDPANPDKMFAAMMGKLFANNPDRGIYRTTDGGASWQKVLYLSDSTGGIDVVINPADPQIVYASMWERVRRPDRRHYGGPTSGIYRSTDGGTTWQELTAGLPSQQMGRINLSLCNADPSVLYASIVGTAGTLIDIYKTTNGGDSWTDLNASGSIYPSAYDWWFGGVRVSPQDPDIVYALFLTATRSINGGASWSSVASSSHVDHHALFFSEIDPDFLILGNDGGINITHNNFATYTGIYYQQLPIGQFYCMDVFPGDADNLRGGAQDNGVQAITTGEWEMIFGGDGVLSKVDPQNSSIYYCSAQYGYFGFFHPSYGSYSPSGFSGNDRFNWKSPLTLYTPQPEVLFIGSEKVYRSENNGLSVNSISGDLTNGPGVSPVVYGTVTSIAVAPADQDVIYAGTDDANVWRTTDGGLNWTLVNAGLPQRWVTSIAVSAGDPMEVFITFSGYRFNDPIAHVYHSVTGGDSWTDISGNLPDIPANQILIHPTYPSHLFLATDVGVYYSFNTGDSWDLLGSSMPVVPVNEIVIHAGSNTLFAATFGRSMYKISLDNVNGMEDAASLSAFRVYPNPFRETATLEFTLAKPENVSVRITNMKGKIVFVSFPGRLQSGHHSLALNVENGASGGIGPGAYVLELIAGNARYPVKVVHL
jgi:photosystem II stability/assembly factor-like uncharacterized protein